MGVDGRGEVWFNGVMEATFKRNWQRTGILHTESCGCRFERYVEVGSRDYHEKWERYSLCDVHEWWLAGR